MVTKKQLREDLNRICRSCLNDKYRLRLEPKDCRYHAYLRPCAMCGNVGHIVLNVRWTAGLKLLSGHAPKPELSRRGKYERKNQGGG